MVMASALALSYFIPYSYSADKTPASKEDVAKIEQRINNELKKIGNCEISPECDDYWTALLTWKYFDFDKATNYVNKLIDEKKIKKTDKNKMIRALRKWPYIKHHVISCEKADPRMVYWMFMTETGMDYTIKAVSYTHLTLPTIYSV